MPFKPWPKDPEEAPDAAAIARAFVVSARALGDADRLALALADETSYRALVTRSRWVALEALRILYPRAPLKALGRLLGGGAETPAVTLERCRKSDWWSDALVDQVMEAI